MSEIVSQASRIQIYAESDMDILLGASWSRPQTWILLYATSGMPGWANSGHSTSDSKLEADKLLGEATGSDNLITDNAR